ncbi:MAG: hypothetical protein KAT01_02520 [Candidatus Aminicenantes bacterium]|nr:hypothetical protein [Candidatus Aminicenantes bacterium]
MVIHFRCTDVGCKRFRANPLVVTSGGQRRAMDVAFAGNINPEAMDRMKIMM